MKETKIYQTVSKEGTISGREMLGPICCDDNPWLGKGYYFWDGLLSNAEWWGKTHYNNNYMIFASSYDAHSSKLFDLVGNAEHIECLWVFAAKLCKELGCKRVKVALVLEMMRKEGLLPFSAIKAEGRNVRGIRKQFLYFDNQGMYYLQPVPKIQLCITDFDSFHIADYKFVKASE